MEGATDKRFRSFLYSQTRKRFYAETRLTVSDAQAGPAQPHVPGQTAATPAPEPTPPAEPEGVERKGKLTRLEQAAMRLSEHCVPPTPQGAQEWPSALPSSIETPAIARAAAGPASQPMPDSVSLGLHVIRHEAPHPMQLNVRTH